MFGPGFTVNSFGGTPQAMTTTAKTLARILIPASLPRRVQLWEMDFSALGINTTTDCQNTYSGAFCSASTAGTANSTQTPQPTDSGGGTASDICVSTGPINYTAEPTTVTSAFPFFTRSPNQRGTAFWQASPGGDVKFPATISTGPVFQCLSTANTGTAGVVVRFSEL